LTEQQKIESLIAAVESLQNAVFIRNDVEYDCKAAADHMRTKWDFAGNRIKTARDFIAQLASASSVSGKPYLIRFKDGREITSGEFLLADLKKLEQQGQAVSAQPSVPVVPDDQQPFIVVLGVAQDGGLPHAGCTKPCCAAAWNNPALRRTVSCIAIIDPQSKQRWIIDATPDFPVQLKRLGEIVTPRDGAKQPALDGILLTHAHIGHYTGLMHLGREVMGAQDVPVYAMPRMRAFLTGNGPWDQLVRLNNITILPMEVDAAIQLNERITVTPLLVPHRDEFSETVGFRIQGPRHSVLYIPDIDKWEKWDRSIEEEIKRVDIAFLDGTFYDNAELPGRDMSEIPHPFIVETMRRLAELPGAEKAKVRFIHLNHTNPALRVDSEAHRAITESGFAVASESDRHPL
jgi:pyrroloquinoline quinone biosynthesis protein B